MTKYYYQVLDCYIPTEIKKKNSYMPCDSNGPLKTSKLSEAIIKIIRLYEPLLSQQTIIIYKFEHAVMRSRRHQGFR
jgi:hypothetical protein